MIKKAKQANNQVYYYSNTAYRSDAIPEQTPIPKTEGAMEQLEHWYHNTLAIRLPWGNYANLHNFNTIGRGFPIAQHPGKHNPKKLSEKVYWNHQCLKMDQSHWLIDCLGFLVDAFGSRVLPGFFLFASVGTIISIYLVDYYFSWFAVYFGLAVIIVHLFFRHIASRILDFIIPYLMKDRGCGFFRQTGMVRKYMGNNQYCEAPFTEFDATLVNLPGYRGLPSFKLLLAHRYKHYSFSIPLGSEGVTDGRLRLTDWDTLQRFMDVSQPLPDIPQMEPFRELDPVTDEYDKQGKRGCSKDYWAALGYSEWNKNPSLELWQATLAYPWQQLEDKMIGKVPGREEEDKIAKERWQSMTWGSKPKEENTAVDSSDENN